MAEDFYKILGVNKDASAADVKKAYRRLARKYHPDVNSGDAGAEEKFKNISEAYEVLSDPEKRKYYDTFGTLPNNARGGGSGGENPFGGFQFHGFDFSDGRGGGNFSDIFSDLFSQFRGGNQKSTGPQRGQDILHTVSLTFIEAIRGMTMTLRIERSIACGTCHGSGQVKTAASRNCSKCDGTGKAKIRQGHMLFQSPCTVCKGKGVIDSEDCSACAGRGTQPHIEQIRVNIPPGVANGTRVRVPGKGEAGLRGGPDGDLFIITKVEDHDFFERKGENLYCNVPITFAEAALGAKVEVPTIDGPATIKIPPGTQSGQKFRIRGKGVPALRGKQAGDQFVEVRVVVPRLGDERSKELLREFAELNSDNPRSDLRMNP